MYEQVLWLLRRWWWLIAATGVVAMLLAFAWARSRPETFVAEGTYLVIPRSIDQSDQLRAMQSLVEADGITTTYVQVAESELIDARARSRLGLDGEDSGDVKATASVKPGTNILRIGARGSDPQLVRDMAIAAGDSTASYVNDLEDVFVLSAIDAPRLPGAPEGPSDALLTLMGLIGGLGLGMGFAYGLERLFPSPPRIKIHNLRDARSNAYDRQYFKLRLWEERVRSRDPDSSFSLGVLHLTHPGRVPEEDSSVEPAATDLKSITAAIEASLCGHDILGYLGSGQFAAILPGMQIEDAQRLVQDWKHTVTASLVDHESSTDIAIIVGSCEYGSSGFVGDPEAERAGRL